MCLSLSANLVKKQLWQGFRSLHELREFVEDPISAIDELERLGFQVQRRPLYFADDTEPHLVVLYGFESIEQAQQVDVLLDSA